MRRSVGILVAGLVGGWARGRLREAQGHPRDTADRRDAGRGVERGWRLVFAPGDLKIRAPRVAVYSDGTAVADADRSMMLTADEVSAFVGEVGQRLAELPAKVTPSGGMTVTDVPDTVLKVLRADGATRSVTAYGLGLQRGYPRTWRKPANASEISARRSRAKVPISLLSGCGWWYSHAGQIRVRPPRGRRRFPYPLPVPTRSAAASWMSRAPMPQRSRRRGRTAMDTGPAVGQPRAYRTARSSLLPGAICYHTSRTGTQGGRAAALDAAWCDP